MAVCRRRFFVAKLLVALPVVWVVVLLLMMERRDTPLDDTPLSADVRGPAPMRSAREAIESVLGPSQRLIRSRGAAEVPPDRSASGDSGGEPVWGVAGEEGGAAGPPAAPDGSRGGEQRGVLLPPQAASGPGEDGKPVVLPKTLTAEKQKLVDKGWKDNAFNQYVSDMISPHRTLPDVRDDK